MNEAVMPMSQRLSHAYIIASPEPAARAQRALELACALVCANKVAAPCMSCRQCQMALEAVNPDVISLSRKIDDKGKTKREIQIDQIRAMAADAWVRPQAADRKVYIIEDAGLMNKAAQNAALKLLEEPPAYAAFILCTDSAESLLDTIRSRCVTISLTTQAEKIENPLALEYVSLAGRRDRPGLCDFCSKCEGFDGEQTAGLIDAVRAVLCDHISLRRALPGVARADAVRLLELCDKAREYLKMNVGAKHIFGLLCVSTVRQ